MSWRAIFTPDKIEVSNEFGLFTSYELLPEYHCRKCAAPIPEFFKRQGLVNTCGACASLSGFNRVYALGCYYKGPPYPQLTRHILDLKENRERVKPLGAALASLIENRYPELQNVDALVPVPAHDIKLNERGFNQADILAIELGQLLGIRILDCLIQTKMYRQRDTSSRDERFDNVKNGFIVSEELAWIVRGRHLLIIDDVFTSGATISECSIILLFHEAKQVDALVLGRTCSR